MRAVFKIIHNKNTKELGKYWEHKEKRIDEIAILREVERLNSIIEPKRCR